MKPSVGGASGPHFFQGMQPHAQLRGNLPDFIRSLSDFVVEFLHSHDSRRDRGLHFLDDLFDVLGCDRCLVREPQELRDLDQFRQRRVSDRFRVNAKFSVAIRSILPMAYTAVLSSATI